MTNEELFLNNIKLAYKVASRYLINYSSEYEDIKQVALLGLWKAVLTYKKTCAISTYAYRVITNEINYYLRKTKKHNRNISINEEIGDNITIGDTLQDENDCITKFENEKEYEMLQMLYKDNINILKPKQQ